MKKHLAERHFDPIRYTGTTVTGDEMTILLWNLSGECVGYQTYRPHGNKKAKVNEEKKYFTHTTSGKNAVFGLETVNWDSEFLFVTEGIFDAARLHHFGLPAVAVLGNNPQHLGSWLSALPNRTIAVVQGDKAGLMLALTTDEAIFLPEGEDVDSLTNIEFVMLFSKYLLGNAGMHK